MSVTVCLCFIAALCRVVMLSCDQRSVPVMVEVVFHNITGRHLEGYTVTSRTASNHVVTVHPMSDSACLRDCKLSLRSTEDPGGYIVALTDNNEPALESMTFHFTAVSLSSFHVDSTTTTAVLSWKLHRGQVVSELSLTNIETQAVAHTANIDSTEENAQYKIQHLQPGTLFKANVVVTTFLEHLNVTLKQNLDIGLETDRCPIDWLANERGCYIVSRTGLAWVDAQHSCREKAAGAHLADLKSRDEYLYVSSYLLKHNLLLLWTGLNDQQEKGQPRWSDASVYNHTLTVTSSLPANQTDCFALQKNATGLGYFLTPFFCNIRLPFICQHEILAVPGSFTWSLVRVTEQEVQLRWTDLSTAIAPDSPPPQIFLQYQEWDTVRYKLRKGATQSHRIVRVPVDTRTGVTVEDLSPGRVYAFSLQASYSQGMSWSLGQTHTAYIRPLAPQNITVGTTTVSQITVYWFLPNAQDVTRWTFVVHYTDVSKGQQRTAGMEKITSSSGTVGWRRYVAVISGLESYSTYRIEVYTVSQHGIVSCGQAPLTANTELRAPSGLVVSSTSGNLTACWTNPTNHLPDGYYITFQLLNDNGPIAKWINHSSPSALWANESVCYVLDQLTPGQTYKVGLVSHCGEDRSQETSVVHTTEPMPIQFTAPLSVSSNTVLLHVQRPRLGLADGVNVCVCQGTCDRTCHTCHRECRDICAWHPLASRPDTVNLSGLTPGTEYQFRVYSTSRDRTGQPYYTQPIKTSLAPPTNAREGVVTDSTIELLWDAAPGQEHSYEVLCLDCDHLLRVLKVSDQRAVFSGLTPGRLYHFIIRTEKESYTDSPLVTLNITAAPSPVEVSVINKTTTSIAISWTKARGVVSRLLLSIKSQTSNHQLSLSPQESRCYTFKGLVPGSKYTIEVISTSGERRSEPAAVMLNTLPEVPREVLLTEHVLTSALASWRPPAGQVEGYLLAFGLLSMDRRSWREVTVLGTTYEVSGLTPGSDYGLSIQSVLGSDTSHAVQREFSTRPAGICALHLLSVNSSSVTVGWVHAAGHLDFHRVTVGNGTAWRTLAVAKEAVVAVIPGLQDGCSYNVSVERVRGSVAGSAALLSVTTVLSHVRGLSVVSVTQRAFSLRWEKSEGCVDHYTVALQPTQRNITVYPTPDGYMQADVTSVHPGTQFTVTVASASSSNNSPPVSRIVNTRMSPPEAPEDLQGTRVGSTGILLSWRVSNPNSVDGYIIRYKEVCPYPDSAFTQLSTKVTIPEILFNHFRSGSTYNFQVAAENSAGVGPFSKSLYIKTSESPPGLVTNLTASPYNHTFVVVTWFLPRDINGLITKFAVKAKHLRTGETVRRLVLNAEDIMSGAIPHCNDAADILSRGTPSPSLVTASVPPVTVSAVPSSASWSVPISVGVDQLRPYTAYFFEVSAFTSDGEGQIASTMARMPESAPEDPPQNLSISNVTSKSIAIAWDPPINITGRFTYVVYLYGPTGFIYNNSTADSRFMFSGLNPYTKYTVAVRAKSAGEVGPVALTDVVTPAEAPSAVQGLRAVAIDSVSVLVSWRSPAQPNGMITRYNLQVLAGAKLLQDITFTGELNPNETDSYGAGTFLPDLYVNTQPRQRAAFSGVTTPPPFFTVPMWGHSLPSSPNTDTNHQPGHGATEYPGVSSTPGTRLTSMAAGSALPSRTSAFGLTSAPPATPPPWLTDQSGSFTSSPSPLTITDNGTPFPGPSLTYFSTRAAASIRPDLLVRAEVVAVWSEELSYVVTELSPFTEYTFRVTASTPVGMGPAMQATVKTKEQAPSSVLGLSYRNISSTSIWVSWMPPLSPNGLITHYTVYGLNLHTRDSLQLVTTVTSMPLTGLQKYTSYKLRVAASTAVGESSVSDNDYIFVFTPEDEPESPPTNLTVLETTPSTATLTWSPPAKANGVIQQYEVLYENGSFFDLLNTSSTRAKLTHLKPFSYYNVSVRAYTRYGHGNQTSDTLRMLSGEDVPGSPPYDLSYDSISPSEVNVTWQPPLEPNGVIVHYSVELWNATHHLNLTTAHRYIHISHLKKYAHYRLKVQAHTRVGPGNYSSSILNITTPEDAPDTPPRHLVAKKLSDSQIQLSWKPPLQPNSDILYYVVRVWNMSDEMWHNVTETAVVISVDSESLYSASVSSWTRLGDGGLLRSTSFSSNGSVPLDPPRQVTVVNVTTSSVTVMWFPPTQPNEIIVNYNIYYSHNFTVVATRVPVATLRDPASPEEPYSHTLTGLIRGANYSLWMTSSTGQGDEGVRSEPLTLLLPEDVPSGPVLNLTASIFSSTAIVVTWDRPVEPNGRPFYLLSLEEADIHPSPPGPNPGPPAVNETITVNTTETIYLFTKLRKYFNYMVNVTPATSAGPAYNHTSSIHVRTEDDTPSSAPLLVSARNLSSSSISVVWQRPLEPNGEITEYSLTLFGPGDSNTMHTPDTSFNITGLLPYTAYNLTVKAATQKGSGPSLLLQLHTDEAGPMSPPRDLTIYNHTDLSVWLSWEPSLEPNGVVTHYGFRIQELITHTVTHQNSSGPSTVTQLSGFRPFSSYQISVASYTRVGHGDQYSLPVTFTTNESVSDAVKNLTCSGVSWDSIHLSWALPVNPNGNILFYLIVVDSVTHSDTHKANTSEYTVTGLNPDKHYSLTVIPVNSAGDGDQSNCTAATQAESVPGAPRFLNVSQVTSTSITLQWAPPLYMPGMLREYRMQLLNASCAAKPPSVQELLHGCVEAEVPVNVSRGLGEGGGGSVTLRSLVKYRRYHFRVAAVTNAGVGDFTPWVIGHTLAGNPDVPPRNLEVNANSMGLRIKWDAPAVLSGPTSYLVHVISLQDPSDNRSVVRVPDEEKVVVVTNLTAFTHYSVTVTAFTGLLEDAGRDGKATEPSVIRTLEKVPNDPPKNVTLWPIPEKVTRVSVTLIPPEEPNGNISGYQVKVYQHDLLVKTIDKLKFTQNDSRTLTADIEGLKGGHSYSIRVAAVNGAGIGPLSSVVNITTGIKAPEKPAQKPKALLGRGGVAIVTKRSITIGMPPCFYSDNNGPLRHIQVIVAESGVQNASNLTNWKDAFFNQPTPYLTDRGFPNPLCPPDTKPPSGTDHQRVSSDVFRNIPTSEQYVIGENDTCIDQDNTEMYCNGPLKPNTVYVFKLRATNILGEYTDSDYSDAVKTAVDGLLTRDEQIIMGVLLSFFLAVMLIIIICVSVRFHQRKEGETYSPREAEIIETKYKLDQLIAVADLEMKEEKLNRYSSFFFRRKEIYVIQLLSYRKSLKPVNKKSFLQHVEDLCANDNVKFQEEFAELPKLLQDLATSDADLPWNRSKNRFTNIKPYNNNRVKLLSEPGLPGSDYINASFISGYLCPNEFIATQGPLPGTVADFWRMIWETGTRTIAMLTQCYEKGRIRCHQYWPEDNKPVTVFGDIIITKQTEEVYPDWTVRALKVERRGEYVVVQHFNYTSWPEHGVPESSSTLIQFVKAIRANRHDNTTMVVHCSAGVGRTGVFIALDHLIQHVSDHDFVDLYGLVAELRSERMCMVQNLAQYMFLHQSTLDLLNSKGNSQSIWFVNYSALEKMDSLDAMEGDVELEWEETTM